MAQNRPKTASELKSDRIIVISVIFYVGCTYLEFKSSKKRPIHAKSDIFLEFLHFSGPDLANFSPVYAIPIQNPYSGPPGIIPPYRKVTHDPPGTSLSPSNPRRSPLHLWQTNSKFALWSEPTRIRWGYLWVPNKIETPIKRVEKYYFRGSSTKFQVGSFYGDSDV